MPGHDNLRSKQKHTGISELNRPKCIKHKNIFQGLNHLISQSMWKVGASPLTWSIIKYSRSRSPLPQGDVRRAIAEAFDVWSKNSTLKFQEVNPRSKADFTIAFESRDHGDGYPFDGPGNTVAHAFFPSEGRIHFDDSEVWTAPRSRYNQETGTNLVAVAVHEIGHALGLNHAKSRKSIMYPVYTGDSNEIPQLSTRDINAIRYLYGPCQAEVDQKDRNRQPNHIPAFNPTYNRNHNPTYNRNQHPNYHTTTQSPRFRYYNRWG